MGNGLIKDMWRFFAIVGTWIITVGFAIFIYWLGGGEFERGFGLAFTILVGAAQGLLGAAIVRRAGK